MATGRLDDTNKGWDETDKYINDPDTEVVPEAPADHDVYGIGKIARSLAGLGDVVDQVAILIPLTPSQDQKDALDANPTLNAGNAVASIDDLAAQAASDWASYNYRTPLPGTVLPKNSNIIEHWKMEEASGNRIGAKNSYVGSDVNTVGSGVGIIGNGASFVRANSEHLLVVPSEYDFGALIATGLYSINIWFKSSNGSDLQGLISTFSNSPSNGFIVELNRSVSGGIRFTATLNDSSTNLDSTTVTLADGALHMVTIIQNGANAELWIDGVQEATTAGMLIPITSANDLGIGCSAQSGGVAEFFDGILDEITIYDTNISSGDVATLYNSGTGLTYSLLAQGEVSINSVDPTLATEIVISNATFNGNNLGNVLTKIGLQDAVVIQDNNEGDKLYNYDVTGVPVQGGGTGLAGQVIIPVAFFSKGSTDLVDNDISVVRLVYDGNNTRFLQKVNNLSDLQSAALARVNLDVYSIGEVDTNIGVVQTAIDDHELDLANPHQVTAAQSGAEPAFSKNPAFNKNYGAIAGTVAQGDDSRFHSNANDPTADQADALDNAPTALTAANPVASVADLPAGSILDVDISAFTVSSGTQDVVHSFPFSNDVNYVRGEYNIFYGSATNESETGALKFSYKASTGSLTIASGFHRGTALDESQVTTKTMSASFQTMGTWRTSGSNKEITVEARSQGNVLYFRMITGSSGNSYSGIYTVDHLG